MEHNVDSRGRSVVACSEVVFGGGGGGDIGGKGGNAFLSLDEH